MFWNKRMLPKPNDSQVMLEKIYETVNSLMNSSYSMPSHINRKLDNFLDEYYDLEKQEYEKEN